VPACLAVLLLQGLEQRLQLAEGRLAGVHNLAGRLMAVDAVAAELGIPVPQPQLASITALGGMQAAAAAGLTGSAYVPAAAAGANSDASFAGASRPATAAQFAVEQTAAPHAACLSAKGSSSNSGGRDTEYSSSNAASLTFLVGSNDGGTSPAAVGLAGSASDSSGRAAAEQPPGLLMSRPSSGSSANGNTANTLGTAASALPSSSAVAAATAHPGQGVAAAGAGACGVLTRSKQQELQAQIDAGKAAAAGMQQQLDDLQQQVRYCWQPEQADCSQNSRDANAGKVIVA
jgi:hypothetical protein